MPVPPSLLAAYDPERFRADGHRLVDALADHLAATLRRERPVLPWREPAEARAAWGAHGLAGGADLVDELAAIAAASTALHHPRCLGHQVAPALPGAALAELASALLNNGVGVAEMGPAGVPIELAVVRWLAGRLGWSVADPAAAGATTGATTDGADGVLTSGGSLGNLTALLAMRQAHLAARDGGDAWRAGTAGRRLVVVTSPQAHYSVARALGVMGWGAGGAVAAAVDARYRLTAAAVDAAARAAADDGAEVVGVVASAGSTATGAFDPLDELAEVAAAHRLWLHVDGAHGASLALSRAHRGLVRGLERADSVVWDAHKLLMMPALVTAVLFRQGGHAYAAFAQEASYLFAGGGPAATWWDLGQRTLECTKRLMAIELWTALRVHGEAWFGEVVDRLIALAGALAARVAAAPDFELALAPEANIVCYRHRPPGLAGPALDAHQRALRRRVVEDGRWYVVGTQLADGYWLRSAVMNPLAEEEDLDGLLAHLRDLAGRP